jgi:upstream activation factor subunit UAF30
LPSHSKKSKAQIEIELNCFSPYFVGRGVHVLHRLLDSTFSQSVAAKSCAGEEDDSTLWMEASMAAKKKAAKKKVTKKPAKKTAAKKKSARKPNAAFMKPVQPDAALAAVVGDKAIPRTELTKKIWAYIRKHGLQDAKNRRMINADDKLKVVFGGKAQVSMFDMTKLVSKHVG